MTLDWVSLLLGLAVGAALAFVFFGSRLAAMRERLRRREDSMEELDGTFAKLAQEALSRSNEQFLQLAQERLKNVQADGAHDLEKRQKAIAELVDPIEKTLKEMEGKIEHLGKAGTGIETQLKTFAEDQRMLRQETQNLVRALRNPAARGRWGEMQLARTLEMIGMVEGTHFVQQQTMNADNARGRPDFIIKLPGQMEIVIDVKTPIEPYWDAMEHADSEAAQRDAAESFKRKVRDHLKQLSSKEYWRHFDSPEFVVMFLPTEGLYSMAVSNDPKLIEDAANSNIILASPTTVMGLLRVAMHGWQQQAMAEEAKQVSNLAADLYNRIAKFGEHMGKLGRALNTGMNAYNQAVGSLESSVLPGARKFKDMHIQTGGREIPELVALEDTPRGISAPELVTEDDKVTEDA